MTAADIARRIKIHNAMQWFLTIGLVPASLCLWWISFVFFRWAIYLPLDFFYEGAWTVSFYLALLCLVPLAIEGVKYGKPLFDMGEYMKSDFANNFISQSESYQAMAHVYGDGMPVAFLISQLLYAAPRTMVHAFKAWRSLLPINETITADAARILNQLRDSRKWTPATEFSGSGGALMVLDGLELIWTEVREGAVEIRYPAGEK